MIAARDMFGSTSVRIPATEPFRRLCYLSEQLDTRFHKRDKLQKTGLVREAGAPPMAALDTMSPLATFRAELAEKFLASLLKFGTSSLSG